MSVRLSSLSSPLPPTLLQHLRDINVRTAADLILTPPEALLRLLPHGSMTLGEVLDCVESVTHQVTGEAVLGDALYEAALSHEAEGEDVKSGVDGLDALLGGSFGGTSGGRALALHLIFRHLCDHARAVAVWMDTTGDLSADRIKHTLLAYAGPATSTVLERLHISLAFDLPSAYDVLESIRSVFMSPAPSDTTPRILVIDTITPLLGPHLSAVSSQGHAAMVTFMRTLRILAQTHLLCILVINSSTIVKSSNLASILTTATRKPALGPSFTFLTDATLWLARPPASELGDTSHDAANQGEIDEKSASDLRVAEVLRSRISVRIEFPLFVSCSGTSILMHPIRAAIENVVCIPNSRRNHRTCLIISRFDDHSHGHVLFGV
ncbi:hypothetical protein HETIRDRAFT_314894 [Heterobasidion irregulare TC 32-1]|uniref:DNA recombination and repair protein Rad51-like C-terminal domain-containing protein n=1 Tax=Heterobasidion irregulare (strain TC 32-1) TaxID=747525 RepID=W4KBR9_HETIT|nr:uncharacterized protein HETIRDRAFT_314894 [Heterobasidion irregulare TC 32-1]ETW83189.1 hypothetical protein HETIRDRAFT_314894 [Heterobasidion irregulare TC 32-1]